MEQKMLLPMVIIVLVGGFIIGYYAATFGGGSGSESGKAQEPSPSTDPVEQAKLLENVNALRVITGTIAEINAEELVIKGDEEVVVIKKSADTKYVAVSGGESSPIAESGLQAQDQVTVVAGVDTASNEAVALSVTVVRR